MTLVAPLAVAALSAILILAAIVTIRPAEGETRTPRQTRYWAGAIVAGIVLVLHTSVLDAFLFPRRWFSSSSPASAFGSAPPLMPSARLGFGSRAQLPLPSVP